VTTTQEIGHVLRDLRPDGTLECEECGMPMFALARANGEVHFECANRHHAVGREPADAVRARLVDNWIAKRGAQLHVQHERWGTDDRKGRDERDI
jgi:hypothetical protein